MISALWAFPIGFILLIVGGMVGVWVGVGLERDHAAEEAARAKRHTHRAGDPAPGVLLELPHASQLPIDPEPLTEQWVFTGRWDQGPAAASAEYELLMPPAPLTTLAELNRTIEPPELDRETDSGFTRRMAREVDAMVAKWDGDTNYLIHTMQDRSG